MIEQALAEFTPQRMEEDTRELTRLARSPGAAEAMTERLASMTHAFANQAAVIQALRAEMAAYRHRYRVTVGVVVVVAVCNVVALAGSRVWALLRHLIESGM